LLPKGRKNDLGIQCGFRKIFLSRTEAKRIIRGELEVNFQPQGYTTNYDIEVWNVNDWG